MYQLSQKSSKDIVVRSLLFALCRAKRIWNSMIWETSEWKYHVANKWYLGGFFWKSKRFSPFLVCLLIFGIDLIVKLLEIQLFLLSLRLLYMVAEVKAERESKNPELVLIFPSGEKVEREWGACVHEKCGKSIQFKFSRLLVRAENSCRNIECDMNTGCETSAHSAARLQIIKWSCSRITRYHHTIFAIQKRYTQVSS